MAIPSSRSRRRPPKARNQTPWLMISFIAITLLLLWFSSFPLSATSEPQKRDEKGPKYIQCRDSCKAVLPKAYSASNSGSSSALSLSAVSAVFILREGEDDHVFQPNKGQDKYNKLYGQVNLRNELQSSVKLIDNLRSRPYRLPPLIAELVGTIDGDFGVADSINTITKEQNTIIRKTKKSKDQADDATTRGLKSISNKDGTVAMVAAAAAAAIWSESKTKRESLTMKTMNDDWEKALRWISSWGQNLSSSTGSAHRDTRNDSGKRRFQRKQNRNLESSDRFGIHGERLNSENEIDFERLLDVCIDRCIGDDAEFKTFAKPLNDGGMNLWKHGFDIRSSVGVFHLISSKIEAALDKIKPKKLLKQIHNNQHFFKGLFCLIISSVSVLLVRNAADWWKNTRYTSSLRSLLEEEIKEARDTRVKCRGKSGKKSTSKKGRRKRNHNRQQPKGKISNSSNISLRDDDSELSEDYFEQRYLQEEYNRKNSDDQTSKEGNTSSSSCTTELTQFEFQMMSTNATISKLTAVKGAKSTKQKHSLEKMSEETIGGKVNPCHKQQNNDRKTPNIRKKCPSTQSYPFESRPSYNYQSGMSHEYNATLIPTAEQREEAARQLREFQQGQIQKLLKLKQNRQNSASTSLPDMSPIQIATPGNLPLLKATTSKDEHISLSSNENENENEGRSFTKLNTIPPPPGLNNVNFSANQDTHETEQGSEVGFILSTLLDEDDNVNCCKSGNIVSTPNRNELKVHEQGQSVALGDLLAGTYSSISNGNMTNALSFNPWKEESVAGSITETSVSSPSHSTNRNTTSAIHADNDMSCSNNANICLQVSALAFSPSRGKGENSMKNW